MNALHTTAPAPTSILVRLRRLAVALVCAVTVAVVPVAVAGSAEAASNGIVAACFQAPVTTNGYTSWGPVQYANATADAYYRVNGVAGWHAVYTTGTDSKGCISLWVPTGYYWRLHVDSTWGNLRTIGISNAVYVAASQAYNGGVVNCGIYRV